MSSTKKPVAIAVSTALASGLLLSGSAFASTQLSQGYQLGAVAIAGDKAAEAKCGEGKCGEGKCGADKMDTNKDGKISKAEYDAAHKDGGGDFAKHDTDKDGFVSVAAMKAMSEGKCGEGKCGEGQCGGHKKASEGKCGEGKCGEAKPEAKKAGEGKCGEGKCGGSI